MNFLRLKTLQISYNLPKPWVNKVHLKNAAVYVTVSYTHLRAHET